MALNSARNCAGPQRVQAKQGQAPTVAHAISSMMMERDKENADRKKEAKRDEKEALAKTQAKSAPDASLLASAAAASPAVAVIGLWIPRNAISIFFLSSSFRKY